MKAMGYTVEGEAYCPRCMRELERDHPGTRASEETHPIVSTDEGWDAYTCGMCMHSLLCVAGYSGPCACHGAPECDMSGESSDCRGFILGGLCTVCRQPTVAELPRFATEHFRLEYHERLAAKWSRPYALDCAQSATETRYPRTRAGVFDPIAMVWKKGT